MNLHLEELKKSHCDEYIKLYEEFTKYNSMNIKEIVMCHYESNNISTKIFSKIGAKYVNTVLSPYTNKKVLRYKI